MIKTIPYNDFTAYGWKEKQDHEFMFQEMKKFVEAGGDLSYQVMESSDKIINFADYIRASFSVEFMDRLMEENLVKSPFSFILNKNEKYITEDNKYGLRWMRDNYKEFEKQILNSVKEVAKKSNGLELDYYSQVDYDGDYIKHKKTHPLYHIASELRNPPEVWKTILDNNSDMHGYMKKFLSKKENFEELFEARWSDIRKPDLANLFYKNNIIDNYLKDSTKVHDLISSAIYSNEIEVLNKFIKNFNLPQIEKAKNSYESFVKKARSPEVAETLLNAGCFSVGIWKGKDSDESKNTSYAFDEHMDGNTLSAIINHVDKDLVVKHHKYFYNTFIKDRANLDTVKILVEKHNFPVEKYDMLQVGQKISSDFSSFESIKWLLEHGADPRNCKSFVETIIAQRDEGKKALGQYKREGLLDTFSSDMIYAMANSKEMKKVFTNYYEKITPEQLARPTKDGSPAWFGVNSQEFFTLIKNKIEDYNQLSLKGDAWVNSLFNHRNKTRDSDSVTLSWLQKAKESIVRKGGEKLSGAVSSEREGNFLHGLFYLSEHGKTYGNTELVKFVFENVDANFVELINKKDHRGQYPLHNFFFYDDGTPNKSQVSNNLFILQYIAKTLGQDFPFEQEINGKRVIELLEKYDSNVFREAYLGFRADKLSQMLPEKNDKTRGIKI
jgi:hypothetical protein